MGTKRIKSAGNSKEFWDNAAKQFEWPIQHEGGLILVPHDEIELAEQNMMVSYFRSNGWLIQSVIGGVEKKKVFEAPVSNGQPIFKQIVKQVKETPVSAYSVGDKFKIKSTECEVIISHISHGKFHLSYTNRNKHDLISSEDQLNKVLKMEVWQRI